MGKLPSAHASQPPSPLPPKLRRLVFLTRLFHALGFRRVFVWTLPIPFHPLIPIAMLIAIPVLIIWRIVLVASGGSGGATWVSLIGAAALLAIPLTIPIVNWFALVFRLAHIQALLIGGAMLLLAAEVALGHAPPWFAALPAAFITLYLVQRIGGPIALRRIEAENAAFAPIDPGTRQVVFEGDTVAGSYGSWLIRHCDVAEVLVTPSARQIRGIRPMEQRYIRLAPADAARVREAIGSQREDDWSIGDGDIVTMSADTPDANAIHIRTRRHHSPLWLIEGHRLLMEIEVDGQVQRLIGGNAAVVGNIPLFVAFCWVAIFGGKSQWVVGFARSRSVDLGTARIYDMLAGALPPLPDGGATRFADGGVLVGEVRQRVDDRRDDAKSELDQYLACATDPGKSLANHWIPPVSGYLVHRHPEVMDGQGDRVCDALEVARAAKNAPGVVRYAGLLAVLTPAEFAAVGPRLIKLLNSKELAAKLVKDADLAEAVANPAGVRPEQVVGGYSLIRHVPALYERLGELGDPARSLIFSLGRMGNWPPALVEARRRLEATV